MNRDKQIVLKNNHERTFKEYCCKLPYFFDVIPQWDRRSIWIIKVIKYPLIGIRENSIQSRKCIISYAIWIRVRSVRCILLTYLSVISSKVVQKFAQKCQYFTLIDQSVPLDNFYITFYLRTNQL